MLYVYPSALKILAVKGIIPSFPFDNVFEAQKILCKRFTMGDGKSGIKSSIYAHNNQIHGCNKNN